MRVHLLVPEGYDDEPSGGNVYDRRLRDGLRDLGWDVVVHELARDEVVVPDGLLLVDSLVASWAAPALLPVAHRVVPLVHMAFGTPGEEELLATAAAVVVTSAWMRELLPHAHVARPGVDPAPPRTRTPGRELLCVGAVVPAKGHDVLVEALDSLADLDWTCTVVGPLDRDPAYVATLGDRITLAGPVAHEAIGASYAGADLLVHPSRHESYGMVVAEALAHGVPVVASDVGGVREAADGRAVLVPPGEPAALAGAIRAQLAGPRRVEQRPGRSWADTAAVVAGVLAEAR